MVAEPADDLLAELARWAADLKVREAAAGRALTRSLLDQLTSSATWEGMLLDLAERRALVDLTLGPARLSGELSGVGRDFVAVEPPRGFPLLARTAAITSISAPGAGSGGRGGGRGDGPGRRAVGGARRPALELSFLDALEALVSDGAPLRLLTGGGPAVAGNAVALGEDLITLRGAGDAPRAVHVPLIAIVACELR